MESVEGEVKVEVRSGSFNQSSPIPSTSTVHLARRSSFGPICYSYGDMNGLEQRCLEARLGRPISIRLLSKTAFLSAWAVLMFAADSEPHVLASCLFSRERKLMMAMLTCREFAWVERGLR